MSFSPRATSLADYALMRGAIAAIATWVFFPSFALTLVAGMLAIAANRAFHDAGWAWAKFAMGILVFAGSFQVLGSIQDAAKGSASAIAGQLGAETITGSLGEQERVVGSSCGVNRQCRAWGLAAAPHANSWTPDESPKAARSSFVILRRTLGLTLEPQSRKCKDMMSTPFMTIAITRIPADGPVSQRGRSASLSSVPHTRLASRTGYGAIASTSMRPSGRQTTRRAEWIDVTFSWGQRRQP
jgi:hypothetical protein